MRMYDFIYRVMPIGYRKWIENQMKCADFTISSSRYSGFSIFYGLAIGLFTFLIIFMLDIANLQYSLIIGITAFVVFEAFMHLIPLTVADKRANFTDDVLPDALRLISSNIRSGLTPDRALLLAARPEFGPLEKEIRISARLTLSGESIDNAIRNISKTINSRALRHTVDLLAEGIARGGNLPSLLDGLANDIREAKILKKEVHAVVMMYAIFIFFAAGIGAPLLFGISSYLVKTMQDIGSRVNVQQTFPASSKFISFKMISLSPEFLLVYVSLSLAITSIFGGMLIGLIQEGTEKAGLRYIPVILGLSLSIFFITRFLIESLLGTSI